VLATAGFTKGKSQYGLITAWF